MNHLNQSLITYLKADHSQTFTAASGCYEQRTEMCIIILQYMSCKETEITLSGPQLFHREAENDRRKIKHWIKTADRLLHAGQKDKCETNTTINDSTLT